MSHITWKWRLMWISFVIEWLFTVIIPLLPFLFCQPKVDFLWLIVYTKCSTETKWRLVTDASMSKIYKGHNSKITYTPCNLLTLCNCRVKGECPMDCKCRTIDAGYDCRVTSPEPQKIYFGLALLDDCFWKPCQTSVMKFFFCENGYQV